MNFFVVINLISLNSVHFDLSCIRQKGFSDLIGFSLLQIVTQRIRQTADWIGYHLMSQKQKKSFPHIAPLGTPSSSVTHLDKFMVLYLCLCAALSNSVSIDSCTMCNALDCSYWFRQRNSGRSREASVINDLVNSPWSEKSEVIDWNTVVRGGTFAVAHCWPCPGVPHESTFRKEVLLESRKLRFLIRADPNPPFGHRSFFSSPFSSLQIRTVSDSTRSCLSFAFDWRMNQPKVFPSRSNELTDTLEETEKPPQQENTRLFFW